MNKSTFIIITLFLLMIGIFFLIQPPISLKSQVTSVPVTAPFPEPEKTIVDTGSCEKYSEDMANDCYQRFAVLETDIEICSKITKTSKRKICEREVEIKKDR